MMDNILCPVELGGSSFGEYANAFRVMQDGQDILLDFCVYSEEGNKARLVSRVRVSHAFLGVILDRLKQDTTPVEDDQGKTLFILPPVTGEN